jgi:NAD(P)-dependent dehydrogenase (short-subunit alcohol dehydrogenase family)
VTGPVVVVTGGASGIGAAVVERFRASGAVPVVADLAVTPDSLDGLRVDVADAASVDAFAAALARTHGRCDVLANVAGITEPGIATVITEQAWQRTFDVNVTGVWRMSRAVIPLMNDGGAIVNVASAAGLRAIPDMPAYVASKAAVIGLTRAMAIDHAEDGIRVNCVCPGLVDTPLARSVQARRSASAAETVTKRTGYLVTRDGEASEIADAVHLLATNGYTTGATLAVDGGRSLH